MRKIKLVVSAIALICTLATMTACNNNQGDNSQTQDGGQDGVAVHPTAQVQVLESGLSTVSFDGNYGFDDFLENGGATSDSDVVSYLKNSVLSGVNSLSFGGNPFGCSTIAVQNESGEYVFGRNFDWNKCNAMIVKSAPNNAYSSISTVNLDFIHLGGTSFNSLPDTAQAIIVLYAPLDGVNEKGLAVWGLVIFLGIIAVFALFLFVRTAKILKISPMQTIRGEQRAGKAVRSPMIPKGLGFSIALREVLSGKKRYVGVCVISILLVVFLSVVGKMRSWLGPNGEGLMNAFSVADHDLGVQPFNSHVDMDEIERVINWYSSGVNETYELAMQPVTVNGQEYTANALDKTEYFHVLKGSVCNDTQILITDTVANELGIGIGDSVTVSGGRGRATYTVSGIYQCANGMGTNIGMSREGYARIADVNGFIWCRHYIFEDGNARNACMEYLQAHYRGIDVHTNSWSGLDGIVTVMHLLIVAVYVIAAVFIFVSVWLSSNKLLQAETGNMAIYKSLGISSAKLRRSFALRFLIVILVGSILGVILSVIFSDMLIASIFKMFGIGQFSSGFGFLGNILPPLAVIVLFFGFAYLTSGKIKKASLVKLISENQN